MRTSHSIPLLSLVLLLAACGDRVEPIAASSGSRDVSPTVLGPSPMGPSIPIHVKSIASGLVSPVQVMQAPGANGLGYIVDQIGQIRVLDASGTLVAQPFLDLRNRITPLTAGYDERGLLGLAFHPEFVHNRKFYVFYTAPPRATAPAGYNNTTTIAEYRALTPMQADPASGRIVLQVDHPQANHNGGTIAFGPDGYLYISIGDGGAANDVGLGHVPDWFAENGGGNGQDITSNLLGNILRINVNAVPYAIPSDNPFVGKSGLEEIWAYGFRNPYRFSFDMGGTHSLLAGDAGQDLWEEVSDVVKGGNYGWNVKEGTHCFDAEAPDVSPATCPRVDPTTGATLRDPVIEFANAEQPGGLSVAVVGGNMYRGREVPTLAGRYVFGGATGEDPTPDGRLFASMPQAGLWPIQELLINGTDRLGYIVKGFGQDRSGEVYVAVSKVLGPAGTTGTIFKITR